MLRVVAQHAPACPKEQTDLTTAEGCSAVLLAFFSVDRAPWSQCAHDYRQD
jgi:hypothetical protein